MAAEQQPDTQQEYRSNDRNKKAPMSSADILLNNNKLNVVETFKYLGVTIDSRLNWQPHYHS